MRHPANPFAMRTLLWERRRGFHNAGGIRWNSTIVGPAPDATERQRISRTLEALEHSGHVTIARARYARSEAVKLTDAGDEQMRALCNLPPYSHALAHGVDRLYELRDDERRYVDLQGAPNWHWELHVLGDPIPNPWPAEGLSDYTRRGLTWLEEIMLPAMCRQLVFTNCTVSGHVFFGLTPKGLKLARKRAAKEHPPVPDLPEPSEQHAEAYEHYLKAAFAALESAEPDEPNELGDLPISPVGPNYHKATAQ